MWASSLSRGCGRTLRPALNQRPFVVFRAFAEQSTVAQSSQSAALLKSGGFGRSDQGNSAKSMAGLSILDLFLSPRKKGQEFAPNHLDLIAS